MINLQYFDLKLFKLCIICLTFPCSFTNTLTDVAAPLPFSLSMLYLSRLADRESQIYAKLKDISSSPVTTNQTTPLLEEYLSDYEQSTGIRKKWKVEEHPLLVYRMIWRFVHHVPKLRKQFSEYFPLPQVGLEDPASNLLPLSYALQSIISIQNDFRLPPSDLMVGKFRHIETGIGLTVAQVTQLVNISSQLDYFVEAWDWLDLLDSLPSKDEKGIEKLRHELVNRHDLLHNAKCTQDDPHIFQNPLRKGISPWRKDVEMEAWLTTGQGSGVLKEYFYQTYALCSNRARSKNSKRPLTCWLDTKKHPYFILVPLKTELLHQDPDYFYFHDVARDEVLDSIWNAALPGIQKDATLPREKARIRSMNLDWINEASMEQYNKLYSKFEFITGLNMKDDAADVLRVSQYLTLGDAGVHHDAYKISVANENKKRIFGDRLATIILYMNDVILGGETVFPVLDLVVKPVKGSLLFWYNYGREGNTDWKSWHGVCPPILGRKRIATTFIGKLDNMFQYKCV